MAHRPLPRRGALLLVTALLAPASAATAQTGTRPAPDGQTHAAITAQDLATRLYIFADDSMMGRAAGTEGNIKGTAYIAAEARRMGLQPAGENGTYFQDLPLVRRTITATLSVAGRDLTLGSDYVVFDNGGQPRPIDGKQAIFGGTMGDEATYISADQAKDHIVFLVPPTNPTAGRRGFRLREPDAMSSAAAVAMVNPGVARMGRFLRRARVSLQDRPAGAPNSGPATILITPEAAAAFFDSPLASLQPGAAGKTVHGTVTVRSEPAPGRNVVAILPGSDPQLSHEYVALGAHNDHLGMTDHPVDHDSLRAFNLALYRLSENLPAGERLSPQARASIHVNVDSLHHIRPEILDSVYNGADDDGSGSVTVLEIAQAFAAAPVKPKRSLLFVWHTGEELGLYGSRYFTDHPTVPRDSIVAQLNMDMVGRGDAGDIKGGGPNYLQLVGSRRLSTELGDLVEAVNKKEPSPFHFDYTFDANGHPDNIYCRSDHYEYARYGIPIVFFTTGLHADYHQLTDEPQFIDYLHMQRVAQLVHDVALTVANLDHRVVVDHPKPDPNAPCRQ